MRRFIPLALISFLLAVPARADVVELKDGTVIEGRVEHMGDEIRIHKRGGFVTIPMRLVKKITKKETPEQIYEKKAKKLEKNDVDAHLKLAGWCESQNLPELAAQEYRKVLAVDSEHEIAREALG